MSNVHREPEWMRAVRRVEFSDGSTDYRPGARMRRTGKFMGIPLTWASEVTNCEPGRLIAFRHTGGALVGESRWEIVARPGGSNIRFWTRGAAPTLFARLQSLARLGGRLGLRRDVTQLKQVAEQQP